MAYDDSTVWFGKYKGQSWETVPDSYLKWMMKEDPSYEKKGTQLADEEMQRRADTGVSVPDEPRDSKATTKSGSVASLEARILKLELEVSKLMTKESFDADDIAF